MIFRSSAAWRDYRRACGEEGTTLSFRSSRAAAIAGEGPIVTPRASKLPKATSTSSSPMFWSRPRPVWPINLAGRTPIAPWGCRALSHSISSLDFARGGYAVALTLRCLAEPHDTEVTWSTGLELQPLNCEVDLMAWY